jgi:hypothetical protein
MHACIYNIVKVVIRKTMIVIVNDREGERRTRPYETDIYIYVHGGAIFLRDVHREILAEILAGSPVGARFKDGRLFQLHRSLK